MYKMVEATPAEDQETAEFMCYMCPEPNHMATGCTFLMRDKKQSWMKSKKKNVLSVSGHILSYHQSGD